MRNYTTGKCNMQCFYTTRSRKILYKIVIFSLCFHMSSEFHDKSGESNKNLEGGRQRDKLEWGGGGVGMSSIRLNQRPSSFWRCLSCYMYTLSQRMAVFPCLPMMPSASPSYLFCLLASLKTFLTFMGEAANVLVTNMSKDVFISIYQKSWKLKDGCGTQIYSRGALLGILYGAYGPVLQILTLFQTKKYHFPHRLSWCWPLNSIPVFTPKWHKNHWKALPICGGTYVYGLYKGAPSGKSLKMIIDNIYQIFNNNFLMWNWKPHD